MKLQVTHTKKGRENEVTLTIDRETHAWLKQLSEHYDGLDLKKVIKKLAREAIRDVGLKTEVVAR